MIQEINYKFSYFWKMIRIVITFLLFPILILAQPNFEKGERLFREEKFEGWGTASAK